MKDSKGAFRPESSVILSLSKDQFCLGEYRLVHISLCALVFLLLTQGLVQAGTSEIDAWLKGFDSESLNGIWPGVELPADASPEKVVEAYTKSQKKTTDSAQYEGYRIIETKKLDQQSGIGLSGCTAVLISSARGSKTILLLRNYDSGWLVRPYFITTVP